MGKLTSKYLIYKIITEANQYGHGRNIHEFLWRINMSFRMLAAEFFDCQSYVNNKKTIR